MNETEQRLSREDLSALYVENKMSKDEMPERKFRKVRQNYSREDLKNIINSSIPCDDLPTEYSEDLRDGSLTFYAAARKNRPHEDKKNCKICEGKTTPVIDIRHCGKDSSFVNFNMFPAVNPNGMTNKNTKTKDLYGVHFLIWPSCYHKKLCEMDAEVHQGAIELMASLEEEYVERGGSYVEREGSLFVIKNEGPKSGESLEHKHYQAILCNKKPKALLDDRFFAYRQEQTYLDYILKQTPIKDHRSFATYEHPSKKRGLDIILAPKDPTICKFKDLRKENRIDLSRAIIEADKSIREKEGDDCSYHMLFHNENGFYVEILPIVQTNGAFEMGGYNVCQENPKNSYDKDIKNKTK